MAVGIRPSLALKGVHLLLDNGLAGYKVVVDPRLTNTLCVGQPLDPFEQEIPGLYPSCAITRAMAKEANQNHGMQDIDSIDTLICLSANLTFRLTLTFQGQTLTLYLQFYMTKVMTSC